MQTLSFATTQMIEGEILGLTLQRTSGLTREQYLEITRRKTAELFAAACSLPTHFAPSFAPHRRALAEYGRNVGMCFQIVDDILDIVGSQQRLGKPVFSDLREGKLTLPFILARPHLSEAERAMVEHIVVSGDLGDATPEGLRTLLERHGAVEEARGVAEEFGNRAVAALATLPPGPGTALLAAAPRFVLERES